MQGLKLDLNSRFMIHQWLYSQNKTKTEGAEIVTSVCSISG